MHPMLITRNASTRELFFSLENARRVLNTPLPRFVLRKQPCDNLVPEGPTPHSPLSGYERKFACLVLQVKKNRLSSRDDVRSRCADIQPIHDAKFAICHNKRKSKKTETQPCVCMCVAFYYFFLFYRLLNVSYLGAFPGSHLVLHVLGSVSGGLRSTRQFLNAAVIRPSSGCGNFWLYPEQNEPWTPFEAVHCFSENRSQLDVLPKLPYVNDEAMAPQGGALPLGGGSTASIQQWRKVPLGVG